MNLGGVVLVFFLERVGGGGVLKVDLTGFERQLGKRKRGNG